MKHQLCACTVCLEHKPSRNIFMKPEYVRLVNLLQHKQLAKVTNGETSGVFTVSVKYYYLSEMKEKFSIAFWNV